MLRKARFQGVSLIEVSISLIIIGIISAIGVSQLGLMQKIYYSQKTQANIDFVIKTLGMYYFRSATSPLPFPSKMDSNVGYQCESMKNSFGIIPFKTLGIMEKFAKDGNGRWLLYKMNPNLCRSIFAPEDKSLGDAEFSSKIPTNKLAFVIKAKNAKNEDELSIEYDLQKLSYLSAKLLHLPVCYPVSQTLRQMPDLYQVTLRGRSNHNFAKTFSDWFYRFGTTCNIALAEICAFCTIKIMGH